MQPRRYARFEGSERSPTSLWSHYTMLKLTRECFSTLRLKHYLRQRDPYAGGGLGAFDVSAVTEAYT